MVGLTFLGWLLGTGCSGATTPPSQPKSESEVRLDGPGEIPWAEGEKPEDPSQTTRHLEEQPSSVVGAADLTDPNDGIVATGEQGRCTGKPTPGLRAEVQERTQDIATCGERLPPNQQSLSGELKFTLRVSTSGEVVALELLSDTLNDPAVLDCAKQKLSQRFEERPLEGCALFVVPFRLDAQRSELP